MSITSEIVIMNKIAVAIAADSAITFSGYSETKTRATAEKIITFGENKPVGFMMYGSVHLNSVPWELLIKQFCNENKYEDFNHIVDINREFIKFIEKETILLNKEVQDKNTENLIEEFFIDIINRIRTLSMELTIENLEFKKSYLNSIKREVITSFYNNFKKSKRIQGINTDFERNFFDNFNDFIAEKIEKYFSSYNLPKYQKNMLEKCVVWLFTRNIRNIAKTSGITIAGFGQKDKYPCCTGFNTFCKFNNKLKYYSDKPHYINEKVPASVSAYAQSDMIENFMHGANPEFSNTINILIDQICVEYKKIVLKILQKALNQNRKKKLREELTEVNKKLTKSAKEELQKYKLNQFERPTIHSIALLSKIELAELAESLIHLTSIKRKTSPELETVADPIDVAIITKNEGFIWMNRKCYIDEKMNPLFFKQSFK